MAKTAVTVTLIFFFIALSYARTPLDLPLPDPSIHLPTQKHDSNPVKPDIADPKPTETNSIDTLQDMPSSEIYIVDRVTLTRPASLVSFHPINRHFNVQQQFGLRLPLHRCRFHKKTINQRFQGRQVPYGNDMILAAGGSHNDLGHHHRHHDRDGLREFPLEHHGFGKEKYNTQFEKEENGFMNKIRKFLKHF